MRESRLPAPSGRGCVFAQPRSLLLADPCTLCRRDLPISCLGSLLRGKNDKTRVTEREEGGRGGTKEKKMTNGIFLRAQSVILKVERPGAGGRGRAEESAESARWRGRLVSEVTKTKRGPLISI